MHLVDCIIGIKYFTALTVMGKKMAGRINIFNSVFRYFIKF